MDEEKKINEASVENNNTTEVKKDYNEQKDQDPKDKKIKNLLSLVVLLAGLFVGSVLVDVVQLISGGGISQKVLNNSDVFELDDKTWVSYDDPIIDLKVINDEDCEECNVEEALVWLRRIMPTISTTKVEIDSAEGEQLVENMGIKSIPAVVFGESVKETEFYVQAESLFQEKDGQFLLNTGKLGLPAGKYVDLPQVGENDIKIGSDQAPVKVVEFSDFQCPYCRAFHESTKKIIEKYDENQVQYVYKHFPLTSIHPQAINAALASECANEQGKFLEYADKLFENQREWSQTEDLQRFKVYARQLGLIGSEFNKCLDDKKYSEKVDSNAKEAQEFGISGTPGLFINDSFKGGAVEFETIKELIDSKLEK